MSLVAIFPERRAELIVEQIRCETLPRVERRLRRNRLVRTFHESGKLVLVGGAFLITLAGSWGASWAIGEAIAKVIWR